MARSSMLRGYPRALAALVAAAVLAAGLAGCRTLGGPSSSALAEQEAKALAEQQQAEEESAAEALSRLQTLPSADDPSALADALMDLGLTYSSLGRYGEAEQSYRQALRQRQRLVADAGGDPAESRVVADSLVHLALSVSNQGRYEEADLLFRRAEPAISTSGNPFDAPRYISYRAIDFANQGKLQDAYDLARESTLRRRDELTEMAAARQGEARLQGDLAGGLAEIAQSLFVEAAMAYRLGRLEDARLAAGLSRRVILDIEVAPEWWLATVDELIGLIDSDEGNLSDAENRLSLAVLNKRRAFGDSRPTALAYFGLGRVANARGKSDEALQTGRLGVDIIRRELASSQGITSTRLIDFLDAAFAEAQADSGARETLYAEMFEASQLARGPVAGQAVAKAAARLGADGANAALIQEAQEAVRLRDQLRLDLGREAARPAERRDRGLIARMQRAFEAAEARAEALEQEVAAKVPGYARVVSPKPLSPARLAGLLQPDEAIAAFSLGDRGGYVFLLRSDGLTAAPLAIPGSGGPGAGPVSDDDSTTGPVRARAVIDGYVSSLRDAFDVANKGLGVYDMARAHELHGMLFGPIADRMAGVDHLIVVPTGSLLSLPFGLLLTEPPPPGREAYEAASWLATEVGLSVAPSLAAFVDLRSTIPPSRAPQPFIGFGNPSFAGGGGLSGVTDHCRTGEPMPADLLRGLAPLPETVDEIRGIARVLGAGGDAVRLGRRASEPAVRQTPLDRYRVVQFATHGLLPGELTCQSEPALALSPPARTASDTAGDGLLEANEIAGLKLDADMVVLSACNTGGGAGNFGGEALSGLASAFVEAGARSLLVTHWVVDSRAAAGFTTGMFQRLANGSSDGAAAAIRAVQARMIARPETAHPFFWAAFTLLGDGRRPVGGSS